MPRNISTTLRRHKASPMRRFDRLPPDLRSWLRQAALCWSVRSAERVWFKELRRHGGDIGAALRRLDEIERCLLEKDAPRLWGGDHPGP
ncbi:hypothetical protein KBY28_03105 [Ruegeria pomeroyi]|uniref:DUF6525 family protein n=1 Tax=Ruegeria pomeroyi TaxID=89184 RepID=UPI001F94A3C4|nr:DUF6525 family protein [Ruegeria pomeroyi]MCE8507432.1 hypothetical protein [Ruegeria pomeroyi]